MAGLAGKMKELGNKCFTEGRYAAAIDAYTEAITLCPTVTVYWLNRALCHKKRNDWKQVEADCKKALELDNLCAKAYYLLGLAMVESKQFDDGIKFLEKAFDLSKSEKFEDYVMKSLDALARARYEKWKSAAAIQQKNQQELRSICERAIKAEFNQAVKRLEPGAGKSKHDVIVVDDDQTDGFLSRRAQGQEYQQRVRNLKTAEYLKLIAMHDQRCHTLSEVFDKASKCDVPSEIPDHLTCKITWDILKDPVITPSGITYERSALLEHLRKNGEFDPWTRATLKANQLISNYAIKEAVKAFLRDNGWAYKQ